MSGGWSHRSIQTSGDSNSGNARIIVLDYSKKPKACSALRGLGFSAIGSTFAEPYAMRWLLASAALATLVASSANTAVRTERAADGTLKVMTFNIQHGIDGSSKYNLQRAIDVIARIQPDIVGLQEVTRKSSVLQLRRSAGEDR